MLKWNNDVQNPCWQMCSTLMMIFVTIIVDHCYLAVALEAVVRYHRIQHIFEPFLGMHLPLAIGLTVNRPIFNVNFSLFVYSSSEDENGIGDIPPIHTCIKSSADYELSLILKEIRFITDQVSWAWPDQHFRFFLLFFLFIPLSSISFRSLSFCILFFVRKIVQLRKEDEDHDVARDWKFAAMVVDRLCLIFFTLFTIIATIAVLLSAPHIIVS